MPLRFVITATTPQETVEQIVSYLRMKRTACENHASWATGHDKKQALAKAAILQLCISDIAGADFEPKKGDN